MKVQLWSRSSRAIADFDGSRCLALRPVKVGLPVSSVSSDSRPAAQHHQHDSFRARPSVRHIDRRACGGRHECAWGRSGGDENRPRGVCRRTSWHPDQYAGTEPEGLPSSRRRRSAASPPARRRRLRAAQRPAPRSAPPMSSRRFIRIYLTSAREVHCLRASGGAPGHPGSRPRSRGCGWAGPDELIGTAGRPPLKHAPTTCSAGSARRPGRPRQVRRRPRSIPLQLKPAGY